MGIFGGLKIPNSFLESALKLGRGQNSDKIQRHQSNCPGFLIPKIVLKLILAKKFTEMLKCDVKSLRKKNNCATQWPTTLIETYIAHKPEELYNYVYR